MCVCVSGDLTWRDKKVLSNYCVTFELALERVQRSRNNCAQGGEPGNEAIQWSVYQT